MYNRKYNIKGKIETFMIFNSKLIKTTIMSK